MPRVQYVNKFDKVEKVATFPTPKRMSEMRYWLKAAQNALKEIPRNIAETEGMSDKTIGSDGWFLFDSHADAKWIRFDIEDRAGRKAHIVIERKFNAMGG